MQIGGAPLFEKATEEKKGAPSPPYRAGDVVKLIIKLKRGKMPFHGIKVLHVVDGMHGMIYLVYS